MKLLHKCESVLWPQYGHHTPESEAAALIWGRKAISLPVYGVTTLWGSDQTPAGGIKTSSPLVKKPKNQNDIRFLKIEQEDF